MTQFISPEYTFIASQDGTRRLRSPRVLDMAQRVANWKTKPEPCGVCRKQPAVRLTNGRPLCGRCHATTTRSRLK